MAERRAPSDLPYDPGPFERHWQQAWDEAGLATADFDAERERLFYNLGEFPYPSAEGLHVGHVFKYCGLDAFGRYQRMRGRAVFQPMGFDAFGINAENYALDVGEHPKTLIARTTANFRRQLSSVGCAWDWSRTIDTSDPAYYRWTQWVLVELFRAGLMYQADAPVLWCPSCLTVLAREQTEGERCERCGSTVVERVMRQWFLRMTAFADRLLAGLDDLDWPERARRLQRAWIGRSEGREVDFGDLTVFTTRPDTLPAVTFLAVPPGHTAAGTTRPHPLTGEEVPVYEADYVVADYGSGAVMGVPAHDERDARFAEANNIPTSNAPLLAGDAVPRVGRPAVRYRMRDWLISRQRYWGPPIPIVHCPDCGPVAVPEDQLPVHLPELDDFRPTGTGLSPLATAQDWLRVQCPDCGTDARRETDVSDTFVDSSWHFLRYPSTDFDDRPWDPERTARVLPVDFYAGGPEHVQRHHLYARFVTMALHDIGHVPFEEPFPTLRLGGFIVHRGAKMSKSRGNVVTPDEYVARHGGDVLRCALLFSAPWQDGGDFQLDAVAGVERFFARLWRLIDSEDAPDADGYVMDRTIRNVSDAIERMRFNIAIAKLMEAFPNVRSRDAKRTLIRLLAPVAPYLAEELWHRLGEPFSVHTESWPAWDERNVDHDVVTLVVQVDGKVRARLELGARATEPEALSAALADARVTSALAGAEIQRVVFVPDRIINLVT